MLSRAKIEAHIYDAQVEPMSNVVDAAVFALRKKIDKPGKDSLIETRRPRSAEALNFTETCEHQNAGRLLRYAGA